MWWPAAAAHPAGAGDLDGAADRLRHAAVEERQDLVRSAYADGGEQRSPRRTAAPARARGQLGGERRPGRVAVAAVQVEAVAGRAAGGRTSGPTTATPSRTADQQVRQPAPGAAGGEQRGRPVACRPGRPGRPAAPRRARSSVPGAARDRAATAAAADRPGRRRGRPAPSSVGGLDPAGQVRVDVPDAGLGERDRDRGGQPAVPGDHHPGVPRRRSACGRCAAVSGPRRASAAASAAQPCGGPGRQVGREQRCAGDEPGRRRAALEQGPGVLRRRRRAGPRASSTARSVWVPSSRSSSRATGGSASSSSTARSGSSAELQRVRVAPEPGETGQQGRAGQGATVMSQTGHRRGTGRDVVHRRQRRRVIHSSRLSTANGRIVHRLRGRLWLLQSSRSSGR